MYSIVNSSLIDSPLCAFLSKAYKIRESSSTVKNSIIFPASGVIFFIFREINRKEAFNEISKMSQNHKKCFILCYAELQTSLLDFDFFTQMQTKFLDSSLNIIPVRNDSEACGCMDAIASAHHKDTSADIFNKLTHTTDPCWSDVERLNLLKNLGFSEHEAFMLLDNLGSIENMMSASYEELLETLKCRSIADKAIKLFGNNY